MTIGELAKKYDAFVVTDEVYEHMVYAPNKHICMASLPGMWERTITCNSLSKTYSITGWRLGWLIGPAEVVEAAKKVHDFLTVGAPAPLQEAAVVGLNFPQSYYDECFRSTPKSAIISVTVWTGSALTTMCRRAPTLSWWISAGI